MNTEQISDWWLLLSTAEQVYWTIAIVASVLFSIVFILSLFGLDSDTDADVDVDFDVDADADFDIDAGFSAFSFRSIVAFFTFFGWTGVLLLDGGSSVGMATLGAFISGLAALFLVAYMLFKFQSLEESGTTDIHMAVLKEGKVYLTIPAEERGKGKVHINVRGALKEYDAVSEGSELKTGTNIKVVDVIDDNILIVEEIPLLE